MINFNEPLILEMKILIPPELAPCGVWCGACPSFKKTCLGCASGDPKQKRTSKWGCRIRVCAYDKEKVDFCMDCGKFPCQIHDAKLGKSHEEDPRFKYRHEIRENFNRLKEFGQEKYILYQQERYACGECGGQIYFYHYTCSKCGRKQQVQ